jgi:hypothetical protein
VEDNEGLNRFFGTSIPVLFSGYPSGPSPNLPVPPPSWPWPPPHSSLRLRIPRRKRHHPIRGHHIPLLGRGHPREAEAVVAELLRDHGASPADAAAIAAGAPGYAAMLVEGVRQLGRKAYIMSRSRRAGRVCGSPPPSSSRPRSRPRASPCSSTG